MPDSVKDFLEEIDDINFMYNNAGKHNSIVYLYNKIIDDISNFVGGYICTNSLEMAEIIEKQFKIERGD